RLLGVRLRISLPNHSPVILTPACKPCSACGAEAAGPVILIRRERNVQPYHDREQRHRPVEKILRCPVCRNGWAARCTQDARGRLAYAHNGGRFMVSKPIDGKPATNANGGTIGFTMSSAEQAQAWHKAGVANGGTSIEDPPGVRQG